MKTFIYNQKYFFMEVRDIFFSNKGTNILSLLSTSLIFFMLALVIGGWMVANEVTSNIKGEAEISVYLSDALDAEAYTSTMQLIQDIGGVHSVTQVAAEEAYDRMATVLGEDADVLSFFEENPFEGFLEVGIDLTQLDGVTTAITNIPVVTSVRNNEEVLTKISQLANLLNLLSWVILFAVGITTLVIVSHIIRQGIYQHKDQINTLELLGAPKSFIATPFYIEGILLTLVANGLALLLTSAAFSVLYDQLMGPLPFIPLPAYSQVMSQLVIIMLALALILGLLGSTMGMRSSRR